MRNRSGKIVATIGPASSTPEALEKLFISGVDVFRLNFSHGTHEGHRQVYESIRKLGVEAGKNPTILADMQGPKLRVGNFEGDRVYLKSGDTFTFDLDPTLGTTERVCLPHPEILEALRPGSMLLLDDGKLRFQVTNCSRKSAEMKIIVGGPLSNHKGVNVPDVRLNIPNLTEKDLKDLEFALQLGVDWVALSFVQTVDDIHNARKIIGDRAGIVAKMEKPLAIKALEPIVEATDAIMVARGDLGVEMLPEEVPPIQRKLINACHRLGRPVIVATQMFESMIEAPCPTRAEISDVANAVYAGADATMLSAESASGKYPFEAVKMMSRTIEHIEKDPQCHWRLEDDTQLPQHTVIDSVCAAAKDAAEYSCSKAIALFTESFNTVVRCSRLRPHTPIIFITDSKRLAAKAGLCHGVHSFLITKNYFEPENMAKVAVDAVRSNQLAQTGDNIVVLNDLSGNSVTVCRV